MSKVFQTSIVFAFFMTVAASVVAKTAYKDLLFFNQTSYSVTIYAVPKNGSDARAITLEPNMQGGIKIPDEKVAAVVIENDSSLMNVLLLTNSDGINRYQYYTVYTAASNNVVGEQLHVTRDTSKFKFPGQ